MDVEKAIKERRSIRKYLDKKISFDKIGKILEAGTYAPSSGNIQNWLFILVRDKQKKEEIAAACLKQYWMTTSYIYIIICNDTQKIEKYGNRGKLYATQNCALAAQNMMLTAQSLNLSTCFVGAFEPLTVSRILKLPPNLIPEIILTLGYADEKPMKTLRNPIERITFFEEYGYDKKFTDTSFWPLQKFEKYIKEVKEKHSKKLSNFYKKIKK
jgi:nitroreductase